MRMDELLVQLSQRVGRSIRRQRFDGGMGPQPMSPELEADLPYVAGDIAEAYIATALRTISEDRILQIIEESGGGKFATLQEFRSRLTGRVNFPTKLLCEIGARLVKTGVDQHEAAGNQTVKKVAWVSILKTMLTIWSHMSRQPFGSRRFLDMVSYSILLIGAYEHAFCNSICTDGHLDEVRKGRIWGRDVALMLHRDNINWFWIDHGLHLHSVFPAVVREPEAKVKLIEGNEVEVIDPHHPDRPIRLPRKAPLMELAARAKRELAEEDGRIYFGDELVAVFDDKPGRINGESIYRAVKDVRLDGARVVVEAPTAMFRPYDSLLLVQGHRYHLDEALPIIEFQMNFRVSSRRQTMISAFAIGGRYFYHRLGGLETSDPWADLYYLLDRAGESTPPITLAATRPKAFAETKRGEKGEAFEARLSEFKSSYGLTKREGELLAKLALGKSNQEIADECFVSVYTVKNHLSHIYIKTGASSRSELIARFLKSQA